MQDPQPTAVPGSLPLRGRLLRASEAWARQQDVPRLVAGAKVVYVKRIERKRYGEMMGACFAEAA